MGRFWASFFRGTTSVPLLIQALEEFPEHACDVGDGSHALSVWLEAWVLRQYAEECERHRKQGIRKPRRATAWEWRSPWTSSSTPSLDLSSQEMAWVQACLAAGMRPTQRLPALPCDAVELAFRWALPNLFQALVQALTPAEVEQLESRRVTAEGWRDLPWLMWAAKHHHPDFLRALLGQRLSPHALTAKGENALFFARSSSAVAALVKSGVSVLHVSRPGRCVQAHWLSSQGLLSVREAGGLPPGVLSAVGLGLGMRRIDCPRAERKEAEHIALAFEQSGLPLPSCTVQDQGRSWPLSTYIAHQSLRPQGRIGGLLPLAVVASRQGFVAGPTVATVKGWPDRGWVFLALIYRLSKDVSFHTGKRDVAWWASIDTMVGAGFGEDQTWWFSPALVQDALVVTRKALKRPELVASIAAAWAAWFERVWQAWEQGTSSPEEAPACRVLDEVLNSGVQLDRAVIASFLSRCPHSSRMAWHLLAGLGCSSLMPVERVMWGTRLAEGPLPPVEPPLCPSVLARGREFLTDLTPGVVARLKALELRSALPRLADSAPRPRF